MSDERSPGPPPPKQKSVPGVNQVARADEIRPPKLDEALSVMAYDDGGGISIESFALVVLAALTFAWIGGTYFYHLGGPPQFDDTTVKAVVERIILAESDANSNEKNKRSSATGAGQFLDTTWLDMIRTYRRDLIQGRSEKEVLELRRNPELAREIITRLVKEDAAMLKRRGLPVTPGTLYLAYFAGPAGAVAVLSASENADGAAIMASADATGQTTREKLVNANPFLKVLTVGDLKKWADRKMR